MELDFLTFTLVCDGQKEGHEVKGERERGGGGELHEEGKRIQGIDV